MREKLNLTAHSGCDGTADDSLESVEAGIHFGADAVEVDVRFNKNGELILSHDEDESGDYRSHPGLTEAFDLVAHNGGIAINCDIKESETVPAVLDLAGEKGISAGRLILTGSVMPSALEENPAIIKRSSVWINIEEVLRHFCRTGHKAVKPFGDLIMNEPDEKTMLKALASHSAELMETLIDACLGWGVKVLNMPFEESTSALIPRMKERGIGASVWTINKAETFQKLYTLGAFNITTRDTRLAVETRKNFSR